MGCSPSKSSLAHVDDSVHVMLKHDKNVAKKLGKKETGYVPRAPHPLLDISQKSGKNNSSSNNNTGEITALHQGGDDSVPTSTITATTTATNIAPEIRRPAPIVSVEE
jgi:hypothetical protein